MKGSNIWIFVGFVDVSSHSSCVAAFAAYVSVFTPKLVSRKVNCKQNQNNVENVSFKDSDEPGWLWKSQLYRRRSISGNVLRRGKERSGWVLQPIFLFFWSEKPSLQAGPSPSYLLTIAWFFTSICPFSSQLSQKRNVPEPQCSQTTRPHLIRFQGWVRLS